MTYTTEQWFKELEALRGRDDEGVSVIELAEIWGVSLNVARERLSRLNREGRIALGWKNSVRIDGRANRTPVYRLKDAPLPKEGGVADNPPAGG